MKKIQLALGIGVMALGLTACGGNATQMENHEMNDTKEHSMQDDAMKDDMTMQDDAKKDDMTMQDNAMKDDMKMQDDAMKDDMKMQGNAKKDGMKMQGNAMKDGMKMQDDAKKDGMKMQGNAMKDDMKMQDNAMKDDMKMQDNAMQDTKKEGKTSEKTMKKTKQPENSENTMKNAKTENTKKEMVKTETKNDKKMKKVNEGNLASDFSLKDTKGNSFTLSSQQGKKVYIKFWASWCPICLSGLEELNELAKNNNDFEVVTVVAPEFNGEKNKEEFVKWFDSLGYSNVKVLFDEDGQVLKNYGVRAYPTSAIVGTDGVLIGVQPGHMDKETIEKVFESVK